MYPAAQTTRIFRSLFGLLVVLAASSALRAEVFLDIPDVAGEATDKHHQNWIVCHSIQFGVTQPSSTGVTAQRTAPGAKFSEITLVRELDVSSLDLFVRAARGDVVGGDVVLELTRQVGTENLVYLRIRLRDAVVSAYSVAASEDATAEHVTLTYAAITMEYTVRGRDGKAAGTINRSWDVQANKA